MIVIIYSFGVVTMWDVAATTFGFLGSCMGMSAFSGTDDAQVVGAVGATVGVVTGMYSMGVMRGKLQTKDRIHQE